MSLRQQRAVQVQRAEARNRQEIAFDHVAEVETEDEIRGHRPDPADPHRVVDVFRREDRNAEFAGQLGDGAEPDIFAGVVPVGKDRTDLESVTNQRLNAGAPDIVLREDHTLHFPLTD
mgnify:CR=1 FL=1